MYDGLLANGDGTEGRTDDPRDIPLEWGVVVDDTE